MYVTQVLIPSRCSHKCVTLPFSFSFGASGWHLNESEGLNLLDLNSASTAFWGLGRDTGGGVILGGLLSMGVSFFFF